jgi:raffinose/stachyose/melibiose transport system substrate-binding protein
MKRSIVTGLAIAAMLALAAAAAAQKRDTVTIRVLMPTTSQAAEDILVANFQRVYPNVKVSTEYLSSATITTLLLTQIQAGNAPDVFYVGAGNQNPASIWPLAQAGRLLDLTGRKWNRRIYAPGRSAVTWNGKVYGWSLTVAPYALLYNADLFKQLGLKLPTRASDLLALCRKITAAGKVPFVQGFGDIAEAGIFGRALYGSYVYGRDPKWDTKRARKQVTFATSAVWRRALQTFLDMKDAGCFQPGAQGTSRPQQYAMFAQGGAAMTVAAATELPNIVTVNPNLKYAMASFPGDAPKDTLVMAPPVTTIAGYAATQHPGEVKSFIDFIAREQQSTLFAKISGAIAPLDAKKNILPDYMKAGLGPFFKAGRLEVAHDPLWPSASIYDTAYRQGIVGLLTGQSTIDTVLANMDKLWDNPS